jgi:hypothetical protein
MYARQPSPDTALDRINSPPSGKTRGLSSVGPRDHARSPGKQSVSGQPGLAWSQHFQIPITTMMKKTTNIQ